MKRTLISIGGTALLLVTATASAQSDSPTPEVTQAAAENDGAAEVSDAQREEWESQLEVAAEEACARAYNCATENVPRLVRRTIKRDQVCEAYQNDSNEGREATLNQECVSASLDYLACVRSASCDDLTGSGARACASQADNVERACGDD